MSCKDHSGYEARIKIVEDSTIEIKKEIKQINAKLNKYLGYFIGIASIPVLMKIIQIFTPIARAMVE